MNLTPGSLVQDTHCHGWRVVEQYGSVIKLADTDLWSDRTVMELAAAVRPWTEVQS